MQTTPIYSSDQAHRLHHRFFDPTGEVTATLLIVHGMTEHSGRYEQFAQYLAEHGIAVASYDHLGHGKTAKNSDELGFFAHEHPVQTVLKDVIIMADALKSRYPDVPHFIMGHSMGSFMVRNVLIHHSSEFAGAILMGTAGKNSLIKALIPAMAMLSRVAPEHRPEWVANTMNKLLNSQLDSAISASQFAWLAEDPDAVKAYEADPLCGFNFTHNGYLTLFALMHKAINTPWYRHLQADFPLLIVSGANDPIGDKSRGIHSLLATLKQAKMTAVSHHLYPNMRHEPLHEQHHDIVYRDILAWLQGASLQAV